MANIEVYSVSAINTLRGGYSDPYYRVRQFREGYEQGFYFNKIYALNNVIDSSINNHTSQYLTSKQSIGSMFSVEAKYIPVKTLTTQITFNTLYNTQNPKYLYIYKNTQEGYENVSTHRVLLTSFTGFENNTYFELEFIDNLLLRVKHNNGKADYYMNYYKDLNQVLFVKYSSEATSVTAESVDTFRYLIDTDGYMQLFKKTDTGNRILTLSSVSEPVGSQILSFVPVEPGRSYRNDNNILKINYTRTDISNKTNSSWVSYDVNKLNNLQINENKSIFDRTDQYILHTNVNESLTEANLNYITLNNIRSEKNYIKRGSNIVSSDPYIPSVEFRDYMSLQTGNSQEKGTDNIALTYVWYDKDIKVTNGTDTYFTAPSSIYPYDKLNINDTKFVQNGSLAGFAPNVADNIYQLRKNNSNYSDGRYLCTWLSGGRNTTGIWVDRYYYPDYVLKKTAMEGRPLYTPSFDSPVDQVNFADNNHVASMAFFDKKSDLCIEPDCTYKYSRVGTDDINGYVNSTSPLVSTFTNFYDIKNNIQGYDSNLMYYDGSRYNKFSVSESINDSNAFTVSFDLFIDPEKKYGYQILGNLTNRGFGVINDEEITPFIYTYGDNRLKVYNTDLTRLYTTEFDSTILDVIQGSGLGDYFVSCNGGFIYRVNTLGVKVRKEQLDIVGYINYFYDGYFIYFLQKKPNSTTEYIVKKVNSDNLEVIETITPNQFKSFSQFAGYYNDVNSIVVFDNKVYILPGADIKFFKPGIVYYTVNGNVLVKHDIKLDQITPLIESKSGIIDFTIDDTSIYVLHNYKILSKYNLSLELTAKVDFSTNLPNTTLESIDIIKQYPSIYSSAPKEDLVLSYRDTSNKKYLYTVSNSTTVNTGISSSTVIPNSKSNRYNATNYNFFRSYDSNSNIKFKLTLTNYLSSEDIIYKDIAFDYTVLDRGYHTFTYRFDPIQGNITLFVDGSLYTNLTVPPGKYAIQNILNDDFYVGTAGFYNNTDLASYLRQPGYYYSTDIKVKNLFIYDRPLRDDEILALDIYDTPINDLVLSVPAGQRNNIEEIERYFKLVPKNSSSKDINIYVKNTGITNIDMQNNIKNIILQESSAILPLGVNINDIQFIDYK